VYYQLGDRFSVDPFLLLQLRGRTKNQILEALREKRSYSSDNQPLAVSEPPTVVEKTAPESAIDRFWQYDEELDPSLVVITPCSELVESAGNENQTILDILGNFPLAAPESDAIEQFLKPIYRQIPQEAMAIASWGIWGMGAARSKWCKRQKSQPDLSPHQVRN
jgi:uncharacterized Zn finger protein